MTARRRWWDPWLEAIGVIFLAGLFGRYVPGLLDSVDFTVTHGGLLLLAGTALLCALPVIFTGRLRRKIDADREREAHDA